MLQLQKKKSYKSVWRVISRYPILIALLDCFFLSILVQVFQVRTCWNLQIMLITFIIFIMFHLTDTAMLAALEINKKQLIVLSWYDSWYLDDLDENLPDSNSISCWRSSTPLVPCHVISCALSRHVAPFSLIYYELLSFRTGPKFRGFGLKRWGENKISWSLKKKEIVRLDYWSRTVINKCQIDVDIDIVPVPRHVCVFYVNKSDKMLKIFSQLLLVVHICKIKPSHWHPLPKRTSEHCFWDLVEIVWRQIVQMNGVWER